MFIEDQAKLVLTSMWICAMLAVPAVAASWLVNKIFVRRTWSALTVTNYRARRIPAIGGMVIAGGWVAAEALFALLGLIGRNHAAPAPVQTASRAFFSGEHAALATIVVVFFALGLWDDSKGSGGSKGLKGHLKALLEGRITTGALKAAGGIMVAIGVSWFRRPALGVALLDALLIAGSANLLNLLDLRPGRACKVFLLCWLPLAISSLGFAIISTGIAAGAAAWLPSDLREKGTLGDSGSNPLGAVLGFGAVISMGLGLKVAVAIGLILLTLASERYSFTEVIAKNPALRWLDALGRPATTEK